MSLKYLNIFISYIFFIDAIIQFFYDLNYTTSLLCLLNSIILICLLILTDNKLINLNILLITIILYISFNTYNLIIWYISFESILIPMIFLLKIGSGSILEKSKALYKFILYTLISGLIMLLIIILLYQYTNSFNYYYYISNLNLDIQFQIFLFIFGIIPYTIKLPIMPLHNWLPETHGEASTSGSIILAALLLKLGFLGIIRWLIPIFPLGYIYWKPIINTLGILSTIYASIICLRQIDIKKLIAYSSISHMGLIFIGLNNLDYLSLYGINILLISHGLVSGLLFLLVGLLYVRTHTRYLYYYKGIASFMPLYSTALLIGLLLNASLPPSLSFIAEIHILASQFTYQNISLILILLALLLNGFYSILLFTKISFSYSTISLKYNDLTLTEILPILLLIILSLTFSFIL